MKQIIKGNLHLNVVSIIGMGGLGKTILARKIYNNNHDKNSFNFGWVYVSQEYRIRELLLEILKGMSPLLPRVMLRAELKEKLLQSLEAMYSKNKKSLKGALNEKLEVNINEMNDKEFQKARSRFLECIRDHDLKKSLSVFCKIFTARMVYNCKI